MKGYLLILLLLQATPLLAQRADFNSDRISLSVYGLAEREDLRWSIAGNLAGQNPNIYSELKWKNVSGPGLGAKLKVKVWKDFFLTSDFSKAFIHSGKVSDDDYQGDNRQGSLYHADLNSNQGSHTLAEAAVGYTFFKTHKFRLRSFAGYSENRQQLKILRSTTAADDRPLNTSYQTLWKGVYTGLEGEETIFGMLVTANMNYYQQNYSAKADWNLIDAFAHPVSFTHSAKGYMLKPGLMVTKPVSRSLSVFLKGTLVYAVTAAGTDKLYLVDGRVSYTRLNEVIWNEQQIELGVNLRF